MKIIDLLQILANDEVVPKKIKVDGKIYEYQGDDYGHKQDDDDNGIITSWLFTDNETERYDYISEFLNVEVEIIEEDKEIEKIDTDLFTSIQDNFKMNDLMLSDKINELIDKVNSLEKKQ